MKTLKNRIGERWTSARTGGLGCQSRANHQSGCINPARYLVSRPTLDPAPENRVYVCAQHLAHAVEHLGTEGGKHLVVQEHRS